MRSPAVRSRALVCITRSQCNSSSSFPGQRQRVAGKQPCSGAQRRSQARRQLLHLRHTLARPAHFAISFSRLLRASTHYSGLHHCRIPLFSSGSSSSRSMRGKPGRVALEAVFQP